MDIFKNIFWTASCWYWMAMLTGCEFPPTPQRTAPSPLFSEILPESSGLDFVNTLEIQGQLNIIDFLYFYNGGGAATGDINHDGFPDLFFTSNQRANRLYLNRGDWTFEDISHSAGIEGHNDWSTGVTMADINADGWLDIYVCAVDQFSGLSGRNALYINNQDGTFTDRAEEYGLAFRGFSNQAAFFDYDHDGDLDCYLLNFALHDAKNYQSVQVRHRTNPISGDHLFRNDNGVFVDVTEESGIHQSYLGYGLGIAVSDFDQDGWEDLYISNDFHEDDYLYLNQGDGTFKESARDYFSHQSRFSMGSDAADINHDGWPDLVTLDMAPSDERVEKTSVGEDSYEIFSFKLGYGYGHQYARNCLHINRPSGRFAEIAGFAGIASTDWSWAPLLADFDQDGWTDLFISNGIFKRPNNLDFLNFVYDYERKAPGQVNLHQYYQDAFEQMPSGAFHDFMYKGSPALQFSDQSQAWGFDQATTSNGAVYADLDRDGDLDLIVNRINAPVGLFRNETQARTHHHFLQIGLRGKKGNTHAIGAKVRLYSQGVIFQQEMHLSRGFISSVEPVLTFGLGGINQVDSIVVSWTDGSQTVKSAVPANQFLEISQTDSAASPIIPQSSQAPPLLATKLPISYAHAENDFVDFNRESLIPFQVSKEGPAMAVGDLNGDGLEDLFAGGAKHQSGEIWLQTSNGDWHAHPQDAFQLDSVFEDVDAAFFDLEGDGDLDLYVASGGNEFFGEMPQQLDRLYLNDGHGNFQRTESALPDMFTQTACVRPHDFDGDGDTDLFVGGRVIPKHYGATPRSYLLVNNGRGVFEEWTQTMIPQLAEIGMVTDAIWADLDGNGWDDLVVVGHWMPVMVAFNQGGNLQTPEIWSGTGSTGLWQSVQAADMDQDGDLDLVVGNLGTNSHLLKQSTGGLRLYVSDFDENGQVDQILTYPRGANWYPAVGKELLNKIMPKIAQTRFRTFESFAGKTVEEIFTPEELQAGEILSAELLETVWLENRYGQSPAVHLLPKEAQWVPNFAIHLEDLNLDGYPDVILAGNQWDTNTYLGRFDSHEGLVLLNDRKGNFQALSSHDSGFRVSGQIRALKAISTPNGRLLLAATNDGPLQSVMLNSIRHESLP
ncbi:VCBS repeat-containing protein [Pontibacter sp. G13]|uniref:VCBS repeat-containing protein n=1 Tax=Pontibacter sp. G13 TaxID=3074898 RepID=UPI002889F891|nr:VCBS repeat-containing protein [Pontibacter sp. G13]WNJ19139.1 VCBS repeat-containing protein [Pontibacter sp. G13]